MDPFSVHVPDAVLQDLRQRLAKTRWPDEIEGAGWDYGTDTAYLRELCEYWREKFDWRAAERRLNAFDQFTTEIQGHRLHFIHQRSKREDAFPLVISHGWPGSVFEFHKIIGPLTDPEAHGGRAEDAFHVVCPSLPGFGFSEAPRERGWDVKKIAEVEAELMSRLGYERYGAQGGDWGASISTWLGAIDHDHVAGVHLNLVSARAPEGEENPMAGLAPSEVKRLAERRNYMRREVGYQQIQSTKPQTLGVGLTDSPAGLASWIVEKFRTWSDCSGEVESKFTKDELLTNITIYWATRTIASSTRLYYETRLSKNFGHRQRVEVPTGCALFPGELYLAPRRWAEARYNVTRWTEMPRGGHFAALEEPELLVQDIRAFFAELR